MERGAQTGHTVSAETREKIRVKLRGNKNGLGFKHTQSVKDYLSENYKGDKNPMYGKKHTEEWKEKMSSVHTKLGSGKRLIHRLGEDNNKWKGGISKEKGYHSFMARKRELRELELGGVHTLQEWRDLIEKYNFMCLCCKRFEPEIKLTKDHIVPVNVWKTYIESHPEIKYQCGDIQNIQPLCLSCNSRKHTQIINYIEFTQLV